MDWPTFVQRATTPLALLLYLAIAVAISGIVYKLTRSDEGVPLAARCIIGSVLLLGILLTVGNYTSFKGYSLKVTVLDSDDYPSEAKVEASTGRLTKEEFDWRLDIAPFSRLASTKLIVRASTPEGLTGATEFPLGKDHGATVPVQLDSDQAPSVHGFIVDGTGKGIDGAVISVAGHRDESVISHFGGRFSMPAHTTRNEFVRINAQAYGYPSTTEWLQAGAAPASIVLQNRTER